MTLHPGTNTAGKVFVLVLVFVLDSPANWHASLKPGGSPGAPNTSPSLPAVLINEILTKSDTSSELLVTA